MKKFKNQQLTKAQQRNLKGGFPCPSGCFYGFIPDMEGGCVIDASMCFGVVVGNQCCFY